MNEQMMEEMDMQEGMEMDPYGEEMDEGMDNAAMEIDDADIEAITFEQIKDTIEKVEDKGKDQV